MGLLYSTEDFQVFGCVAPLSRQLHEAAYRAVLSHAGWDLRDQVTVCLAGT